MAKTWTIVIFTDEDTVEAVPSNWIHDNECFWPSLTFEKLTAAIKNHEVPNTSWPSYPIRILRNGTFTSYSTAKETCRKAEYSSNINSDSFGKSLGYKRKATRKTFGSSFEENISSSSDDTNNLLTKLPTLPRLTNETSSIKTNLKRKSEEPTNDIDRLRNIEEFRKKLSKSNDNEDLNVNDQLTMTECKCCPVHLKHNCGMYVYVTHNCRICPIARKF
ncbi:PREDICTED: uncharacterized protein LOC105563284 [Vollenhovia emeryi]|uniref:uncharacterized protein LOC105563284 n=1 Tax=Vollenhovia emeryi TaxID=411798 RepID=UPI0005F41018|nr:PREDICTED: uncharacterized protein LOC105563284 [Vollenhovia emeryi]